MGAYERMEAEYRTLRDDERQWLDRTTTLGSVYIVAAGGTFFFLLKSPLHSGEQWIYALTPYPSLTIIAIAIRQAITATVRGRLLMAYEKALASRSEVLRLESGQQVPVGSTYHSTAPWLQGARGGILSLYELLPFFFAIALFGLSIARIDSTELQVVAGVGDAAAASLLIWIGVDGLISPARDSGFARLERRMATAASLATTSADAAPPGAHLAQVNATDV